MRTVVAMQRADLVKNEVEAELPRLMKCRLILRIGL